MSVDGNEYWKIKDKRTVQISEAIFKTEFDLSQTHLLQYSLNCVGRGHDIDETEICSSS